MCLVAIAWKVHPDFPLVISANRDEFFERPTQTYTNGIARFMQEKISGVVGLGWAFIPMVAGLY